MIEMRDLRDDSVLLNAISGFAMFITGLFLMRYYYAEHLVRVHEAYSEKRATKRGLVHSVMCALPYLVLFLVCWDLNISNKLRLSTEFHFVNNAFCVLPFIILAKEHIRADYSSLKQLAYYSISTLATAGVSSLNGYFAFTGIVLQAISSIVFWKNIKNFAPAIVPELSYALSPFFRGVLQFIRDVLFPLEFVLDWSILCQNTKNKRWMPSLPIMAFISPYINAFLIVAYYRFSFPLATMTLLSALTFFVAILLFLCARKSEYRHFIQYYSFIVTCTFLYSVISEQLRISKAISRILDCQTATAVTVYLLPYICLLTFLLHAFAHSTGQKQPSLFGVFFAQLMYSFVSLGMGIIAGLAHGLSSVAWDPLLFVSIFLSSGLSLTTLYYTSKYFLHISELPYICLFYAVLYVHALAN